MSILVVVAHSDDETIGASHLFGPDCRILHATDSAPRNPVFYEKHGFTSRDDYKKTRRRELLDAVQLAGMTAEQCKTLDIADQEAIHHIDAIVDAILHDSATVIYTHAYEGGHPDHDSCALACALAAKQRQIEVREMPYYHAANGAMEAGTFIRNEGEVHHPELTQEQIERKQRMFDAFTTQRHVFDRFQVDSEPWRLQPAYDFTQPPHPGRLYYETRPLGWTSKEWLHLAAAHIRPATAIH